MITKTYDQSFDFQYLKQLAYYQYCLYCQTLDNLKNQISKGLVIKSLPPSPPVRQLSILKEQEMDCQFQSKQNKKNQKDVKNMQMQISDDDLQSQFEQNSGRPKKNKTLKKNKKLINQRPERNILTNLGNQILTYIYLKKKNIQTLKSCFPNLTTEQYSGYYIYAKQIKDCMKGYINYEKLRAIWHKNGEGAQQILYQQIIRALSFYYLNSLLVPAVLTSKKMAQNSKPHHLTLRRKLLRILKQNQIIAQN